jgi:predicted phage-related endonuclease
MEPGIAELYRRRMDMPRLRKSVRRVDRAAKWRTATPDYQVMESGQPRRLVELKWVGPGQDKHWDIDDPAGVPAGYRDQCDWQMGVSGIHEADLGAFFASQRDMHVWRFGFEQEREDALVELGKRFWFEHVVREVPPGLDFTEAAQRYLRTLHPYNLPEIVAAPLEAEALAREYAQASEDAKAADLAKRAAKHQLCSIIGDNAGIDGPFGRVTWKLQKTGRVKDQKLAQAFRNMLELRGVSADELDAVVAENTSPAYRAFRCVMKKD